MSNEPALTPVRIEILREAYAVLKDAECSLACIKLSVVLFAGSLIFMIAPALWWSDGVAAIVLSLLIAWEGVGTIRGALKPDFAGGCSCS